MERRGDKDAILLEEQTIMSGEVMAKRPMWLCKLWNCGLVIRPSCTKGRREDNLSWSVISWKPVS